MNMHVVNTNILYTISEHILTIYMPWKLYTNIVDTNNVIYSWSFIQLKPLYLNPGKIT